MLLTSCAPQDYIGVVDPPFLPYTQEFERQGHLIVNNTDVHFGEMEGELSVGECANYSNEHNEINIKEEYWNSIDADSREVLLFHELGHCVLKQDHRDSLLPDGYPASIMHYQMFSGKYYKAHKDYYMKELFNQ